MPGQSECQVNRFFFLFFAQLQPPTLSVVAFGIQIKILFKCAIKYIIHKYLYISRYILHYIQVHHLVVYNNAQHNSFIFHRLRLALCLGPNPIVRRGKLLHGISRGLQLMQLVDGARAQWGVGAVRRLRLAACGMWHSARFMLSGRH